jgi:peptide subunit release factor 1 (eRF1)
MKLQTREQIENLAKFRSESLLTTSFYLDTDKSRLRKKEISLSSKNLIKKGKSQLEGMSLSKEKKDSLSQDLNRIHRFCSQNLRSYNSPGLAIFSCSGQNFWQVFELPHPARNRIIFDKDPYVRLLSFILNAYHHIFVLTLDRREAKWYDVNMGQIFLIDSLVGDVPSKVKEGGWEGYESKRIERHIATLLHEYFKKVAQKTFALFKKNHFDWLFLGCKEEYCSEFESLLHPYLKKRLQGYIKANPSDSQDKILKESGALEKTLKKREDEETIKRFVSELEKGGRATSGLKNTLKKINRGEVQTLLVTRNFSKPGRICPRCHFLYVDELRCPSCQKKTDPQVDIIDEAVEATLDKNGHVKHINPPSTLNRYGKMGAFLRYKA